MSADDTQQVRIQVSAENRGQVQVKNSKALSSTTSTGYWSFTEIGVDSLGDLFKWVGGKYHGYTVDLNDSTHVSVEYTVAMRDGVDTVYVDADSFLLGNLKATGPVTVTAYISLDYLEEGAPIDGANRYDSVDDADQDVVTFRVEGWNETTNKATGKYDEADYVASSDESIEAIIQDLNRYYDAYLVEDDLYELVFYVKNGVVTANWEKNVDPEDKIVYGTPTEETENPLDKDGDGIVTCDEYYGVTGLKWDDKKNACVTTSGNAVVTVPDTSAR